MSQPPEETLESLRELALGRQFALEFIVARLLIERPDGREVLDDALDDFADFAATLLKRRGGAPTVERTVEEARRSFAALAARLGT